MSVDIFAPDPLKSVRLRSEGPVLQAGDPVLQEGTPVRLRAEDPVIEAGDPILLKRSVYA
jgi:hypothetical protein